MSRIRLSIPSPGQRVRDAFVELLDAIEAADDRDLSDAIRLVPIERLGDVGPLMNRLSAAAVAICNGAGRKGKH